MFSTNKYELIMIFIVILTACIMEYIIPYETSFNQTEYDTMGPIEQRGLTILCASVVTVFVGQFLFICALIMLDKCWRDDNDW